MRLLFAVCALIAVFTGDLTIAEDRDVHKLDSISSNGVERRWRLFIPDQYQEGVALPLILNFHGTGSTPEQQSRISEFEVLAERSGFFVASPEAKYPRDSDGLLTWNVDLIQHGVDDVLFVQEMIIDISNRYSVDPKRIYAAGFSGGGRMSSRLACDLSEVIAAIGPVAGVRYPEDCDPTRPVPVITFHGKTDQINHYLYQSSSPSYWRMGVEEAIGGWIHNNKCADFPVDESASETVSRVSYRECQDGADIVFYRSEDAGHTWPGSPFAQSLDEMGLGITNGEIAATVLIWEFFQSHPMQ